MGAQHTPGPWKAGYGNINVVAVNVKIGGETPVCDIRGWGYLTGKGHGALGLPHDEALAIQDANARLIAAAPDLAEAAADIIASRSSTFKARNGRDVGVQDEHGEKMWLVPFDEMLALEAALAKAVQS